jgi:hypothetical protein
LAGWLKANSQYQMPRRYKNAERQASAFVDRYDRAHLVCHATLRSFVAGKPKEKAL